MTFSVNRYELTPFAKLTCHETHKIAATNPRDALAEAAGAERAEAWIYRVCSFDIAVLMDPFPGVDCTYLFRWYGARPLRKGQ